MSSSMLTRCPHCQTTFRVSPEQLEIAKGKVRCGKCQQVFNAREHIQVADTSSTPAAEQDTPPTPPPQVDWLQQARNSLAEIKKINLTGAAVHHIEEPAATPQETTESDSQPEPPEETPTEEPATTSFDETALSDETENESLVAEAEYSTQTEHTDKTDSVPSSDNPLIPGDLDLSFQKSAEATTLEGIAPAYEDDSQLNAREERGLDDLHIEIERQLQTPESEAEDDIIIHEPTDEPEEVEADIVEEAEDSEIEYNEASAIEDIELNALPEDKDSSVIWNEDTHHDPEIPAALRSSMQALEKNKKRHPIVTLLMAIVLLVLIAGLGAQAIVFRSYDIATQWPKTRPWLSLACHYVPCVYTGPRDPRKIQLVNRDIRALPSAKHALLISATLLNQASYAQPFPRIDIKLSDLSGEAVAERIFAPRDYLKKSESQLKLLRPNIPTVITLEVLDPGSDAVNFEFRFL